MVERVSSEQAWGYFDYQNNLKKKCTILEYCRRVTGKRMPVVVSVFRDIQAVFSQNTSQLWFTFPFCSDMTDSWISRVLLASGAQPPRRSASCRRLYSCSQVDSSDIRRCAPSGVDIEENDKAPDRFAMVVSRGGARVEVYSGTHIDYRTDDLRTYVGLNYPCCFFFQKRALAALVDSLAGAFLSLGFKELPVVLTSR
jgi:hypothetical protein